MFARVRSGLSFSNVTSLLALFVALGGTAYAVNTIGSDDIIDESIQSVDIKDGQVHDTEIGANAVVSSRIRAGNVANSDLATNSVGGAKVGDDTLTGSDILESSLGAVPIATNADQLGGDYAEEYQHGCQPGAVKAYARVMGGVAGFPTTDTSSSTYVNNSFWCSAGPIQVSREGVGSYTVTFPPGGVITHVLVTVHSASGGGTGEDDFATVKRNVLPTRMEAEVTVRDADGGREDAIFSIVAF